MFSAAYAFGQIKVVAPNGDTKIGNTSVAPAGKLHVEGGDVIFEGGDVGIGTDTPSAKTSIVDGTASLHFKRITNNNPNNAEIFDITTGATGSGHLRVGAIPLNASFPFNGAVFQAFSDTHNQFPGQFYFDYGTDPTSKVVFRSNGGQTTRMTLDLDGNLGIGTASPNEKLHVVGNIQYTGALIGSDKRLKKNIKGFKMGLKEVLQLDPKQYQYNGKGSTIDGDGHIGLLAQDLEKVVPQLVVEQKHDVYSEPTVESAGKLKSSNNYLAIKDNEIKYLLINAIKDQQKIIDDLNSKIDELSKKVDELDISSNESINPSQNTNDTQVFLDQNVPNPFNGETIISYASINKNSTAFLAITDLTGKLIENVQIDPNAGNVRLNLSTYTQGVYNYSLIVDGQLLHTKQMIVN